MKFLHLIARARPPHRPLIHHEACAWLWAKLRESFPDAITATLMPNHSHLLTPGDPGEVVGVLGAILSGFTRRFHPQHDRVFRVEPPRVVPADQVARVARYGELNPCRAPWDLADDPLEHPWSTHRDVMGAIAVPWVTPERLAAAVGWRFDERFLDRWHAYVTGDPSVDIGGTPPPEPAPPVAGPIYTLEEVARAAAAATRRTIEDVTRRGDTRRLYVQLARHQGWIDAAQLAATCSATPSSVRRLWSGDRDGLAAAALCLGDRRILDGCVRRRERRRG